MRYALSKTWSSTNSRAWKGLFLATLPCILNAELLLRTSRMKKSDNCVLFSLMSQHLLNSVRRRLMPCLDQVITLNDVRRRGDGTFTPCCQNKRQTALTAKTWGHEKKHYRETPNYGIENYGIENGVKKRRKFTPPFSGMSNTVRFRH